MASKGGGNSPTPNLVTAVRQKKLNPSNGKFSGPDGSALKISEAVSKGLLAINVEQQPPEGISLCDALRQGLVEARGGKVMDRYSGKSIKISEAISRGIINPDCLEIYDGKRKEKITLKDALAKNIIDDAAGKFTTEKGEKLQLPEALKKNLICNPMTLKECDDNELIDKQNKLRDPINHLSNMNILEAIGFGLLDIDLKSIRDVKANEYLSLAEALNASIITLNGEFKDSQSGELLPLPEAVKRGHLTTVARKSIFDIEGIKDQATGNYISFNAALESGTIDKVTGKFVDKKSKHKIGFSEAAERGLIQPQLLDMLKKTVGIKGDKKKELTLLEAVTEGRIDTHSGLLVDTNTTNTVPMDKALQLNLITPLGAAILKSLMNITVTTATVTQTVRRTIKVSSAEFDEGVITFQEALRRGLIDDSTGIFTHPETGKELPLDEAISLGLLKLSPASSMKSSPMHPPETRSRPSKAGRFSPERSFESSRPESPDKSRASPKRTIKPGTPVRKDSQVESLQTTFEGSERSFHETSSQSRTTQMSSSSRTSEETRSHQESGSRLIPIVVEDTVFKGRGSRVSTTKQEKSTSVTGEAPNIGLTLRDAITRDLLDPVKGMFAVPESDQLITFKESVLSGLIDSESASVTSPDSSRATLNLKVALERNFLNETAHYVEGRKVIPLQQALKSGKVRHVAVKNGGTATSVRKSSTVQVESSTTTSSYTSDTSSSDTINIAKNIRYNTNTKAFEVAKDITAADLLQGLKEGKIRPTDIQVQNSKGQGNVNILEALQLGLINRTTGDYLARSGKKMNIVEAIQAGFIAIVGAPGVSRSPPDSIPIQTSGAKSAPQKTTTPTSPTKSVNGASPKVSTTSAPRKPSTQKSAGKSTQKDGKKDKSPSKKNSGVPIEGDFLSVRGGTIRARVIESGVTTTKISSFMVEVPSTGEEITLEEAVKRGLVSEETAAMYKQEVTTDSAVEKIIVLITDPDTGIEMPSEEAIAKGIVTKEEVEEILRMKDEQERDPKLIGKTPSKPKGPASHLAVSTSTLGRASSRKGSSSESSSSSSSTTSSDDENDKSSSSYRSELTIEIDKNALGSQVTSPMGHEDFQSVRKVESASHSIRTKIVNLKTGYALSNIDEVRNLVTGETMSLYEAKLRGIATDVKDNKADLVSHQLKLFVSEAVSKGLINFSNGTFANPSTGQSVSLSEAIRMGLLITDFNKHKTEITIDIDAPTLSLGDAIQHCFDSEKRVFYRRMTKQNFTLDQAVSEQWINGKDIIFDVTSNRQLTIVDAMKEGVLNGKTLDYKVVSTNTTHFLLDAANKGLVAVFPEPVLELEQSDVTYSLKETLENGVYHHETRMFIEFSTQQHITIFQALKIGLIDFRSAEIQNSETGASYNLLEAIENSILDGKTSKIKDVKNKKELTIPEAFEKGLIINVDRYVTPFESISIWEAIDREQLDTETGLFFSVHEEKKTMTLEEAIYRKYIEKKSAFVKDTWKRKYCSLSEASRKKIIKDGRVMNTTTGKYLVLRDAIDQQIIVRDIRSISLIDALDFGMYQPHSGKVNVPGHEREITLGEMIDLKLIDHTKTIVKSRRSNRYISTRDALRDGDLDPLTGMYGNMNLLEARSKGYLLSTDAMQAVQEKFRLASENLDSLNAWLEKVEKEISSQESIAEDVHSLKSQIKSIKRIKSDLDDHSRPVQNTLDIISELLQSGSDVVSGAELNQLQLDGRRLKDRFDSVASCLTKLQKMISTAYDELKKFSHEMTSFKTWIDVAYQALEDKESQLSSLKSLEENAEAVKTFVGEVVAHGADLKFLTISGQKFIDISKDYFSNLNEFCVKLRTSGLKQKESQISIEVTNQSSKYHELVSRANKLVDRFSWIGNKTRDYNEAVQLATKWLDETEPKVSHMAKELVAAEPKMVDKQLYKAKNLNNDIINNSKLIHDVEQAAANLFNSLDGSQLSEHERNQIEKTSLELQKRYKEVADAMANLCADLDTALIQSQGVLDAMANLASWLDLAENQLNSIKKPASLIPDRLDEQIRQLKLLEADVDSHETSIQKMFQVAQEFIKSGKNSQEAKKIDTKVTEIQNKYKSLVKTVSEQSHFFNEVSTKLNDFIQNVESFDEWYVQVLELLENKEVDGSENQLEEIAKQKDSKKPEFDKMIKDGKNLVGKKDITDSNPCKETIIELEEKWQELSNVLGEHESQNRARKQSLNVYEAMKEQITTWIIKMEHKVNNFSPVPVELDLLKQQTDELKPINQEYKSFNKNMEKFREIALQYDSFLHQSQESVLLSRRQSVSPRKPSMTPSGLGSHRLSTHSGKFPGVSTARKESTIPSLYEQSPIQVHLTEVTSRYEMIGIRLGDREKSLKSMQEDIKIFLENFKQIHQLLQKQEKVFSASLTSADKKESEKQILLIKNILDVLYSNQPLLDETKVGIKDILKKNPNAPGSDHLEKKLNDAVAAWKAFQEQCKTRIEVLEELKEFHDVHDSLNTWLMSKGKMMNVLGPIASDPRLVQNQLSQIAVMREDFNERIPQKERFLEIGNVLKKTASESGKNIDTKLKAIQSKWDELLGQLEDREKALNELSGPTRDFFNLTIKLQDNLSKISEDLDDIITSKVDVQHKIKTLEGIASNLNNQRPLWAQIESVGKQLQAILTDSVSKSEIKSKLTQVERQFNNCQKKLDNALAEFENIAKEGKEFDSDCQNILNMIGKFESLLSEKILVSANIDKLKQQIQSFEPIYQDIMSKEHEIIIVLNKGKDILKHSSKTESKTQQQLLDTIEKKWQKSKKTAQDYQKRLNTAMEYCKKFNNTTVKFETWLDKAEAHFLTFTPLYFTKVDLQKQEKDLQIFRNDVNRHSNEFDGTKANSVTLTDACDIDQDIVAEKITILQQRWDTLNASLNEKAVVIGNILAKLADFNDNVRDVTNSLSRLENKVSGIEKAPRDTKSLELLIGFLEETKDLENTFVTLHKQAENLLDDAEVHKSDASCVQTTVLNLRARMDSLQSRLEKQTNFLNTATTAVREFNEKTKQLHDTISKLYDEFNKMSHIARDTETLQHQSNEIKEFILKISQHQEETTELSALAEHLISQEYVSNKNEIKEVVTKLRKQLDELNTRALSREKDVTYMLKTIQAFYNQLEITIESIQSIANEEKSFGPVGGDVDQIKSQQEKFRIFQKKSVEAVAKSVEKINNEGQGLIQTAASGVNTSTLEKDLEKMNEAWNSFKKSIADREKRLDQCLIQSGKFQDALKGINSWFEEMDDMISNQKPPSSDYKVVKAQVQEQKFVVKLLADRKNGIDALVKIGREIASSASEKEKQGIEDQISNVEKHFNELSQKCNGRMLLLEKTLPLAKDYQDKLNPIEKWLEQTERKMKIMEVVPTDESQIQKSIKELEVLQKEIASKEPHFKDLENVANTLMQLVGDDDAKGLKDTIDELKIRFNALLKKSDETNKLLQHAKESLRSLVLAYEELLDWMEKTESKLLKFRVLSVFTETLLEQMENIHTVTEDIVAHQKNIEEVITLGNNLMKYINNEEALQLKDKIDSLQRKYNDLATKAADLLKNAQEMMPLVQSFHQSHNRLYEWFSGVEEILQSLDSNNLEDQEIEIKRLEQEVNENRPLLENINSSGPKLCQVSPGEGAKTIEDLVARDNRRFDNVCEQIKKKSERIQSSKQKSLEIVADITKLLDWFREIEEQLKEAQAPSSEPDLIRIQLKEHKAINDEVSSQKGRVKDVLSNAKKVLREIAQTSETEQVKEKMEDLRETMEIVIKLSIDRLSILEQALPLSEHFYETHNELTQWLDGIEHDAMNQLLPGMRPDLIAKQQEINRSFMQSVQDHKAVLDRLNKTGGALLRLIVGDDSYRIQDIIENDNQRYNALKAGLREMQQALDQSMQECSQFTDQLDGMLNALATTSDNLNNAEPISAHPEKIKEQMEDNNAIIYDIDNKEEAFDAVRKAAADVIDKATNKNDPAIKDMKKKLDKLNHLWNQIKNATKDRSDSLKDALTLAENFWSALQQVLSSIKTIENNLVSQEPPAVEPKAIEAQKAELKNIMKGIEKTKPGVDGCLKTGKELLTIVGEPEKPELKQHIEELSDAWENITALYAKRESNLIDAMEKAMEFHENRQNLLDFLSAYEKKFNSLEAVTSDIDAIKKQIDELKTFKNEVDPWMVNVEALNRQALQLTENASPQQSQAIREALSDINRRWEDLNKAINNRQKELEQALLRLGQFQHALSELLVWISKTDQTLDSLKPVLGDPQVIEVELAKLKVMVNDIQAHQSSVDTLNDAGRQIMESEKESREASQIQVKINELNSNWNSLLTKAEDRQLELEDILKEARAFSLEIQDMLLWLNDIDAVSSASRAVGGLPETAKDQLDRFMELYAELEETGPKIDALLGRGNEYLKKTQEGSATNLQNSLNTLKTRWENIHIKMNDKKIKLEIALKEAQEFHDALQAFIEWLTNAEKILSTLPPVSRVFDKVQQQIEEHKEFQNEVSSQRENMLSLEKKGSNLKHFAQKQDVILIKNLLTSVQTRWEKIVSKSAERTKALDLGYKEAKEFHDNWESLCKWLDTAAESLEQVSVQNKNDLVKIKKEIEKIKEFKKELYTKQPAYDSTMKCGKHLSEKASKADEPVIKNMMSELKNKWINVSNLCLEKEKKLEEALLFSGQFKDAIKGLLDWLNKMNSSLDDKTPVRGDLDTVMGLVEKHKNFEGELKARTDQVESLKKTVSEMLATADKDDAVKINAQMTELTNAWEKTWQVTNKKTSKLEDALKEAEELHKSVNMLLEWLSDAEMKLRFSGPLPEDEDEVKKQIAEHAKFMAEVKEKEKDKDYTLKLAHDILANCHPEAVSIIKQWITIIQSRWDEVASWAIQRNDKLNDHLKELKDILALLDELMQWLVSKEDILTKLEQEPLPDDLDEINTLINEHQEFMDNLSTRQPEIDSVCKPMRPKSQAPPTARRMSKIGKGQDIKEGSPEYDPSRRESRVSTGTDRTTPERRGAPRFPDRKGSQANVAPDNRSPRAKALWDKWRHVWMMAWERDRRLKDKLNYLQELEKVKNFDWDEWRKNFLKHNNNKKSRVTDLLRKLDEDGDGNLTRDEFVDGILRNKFPSSRLEMNAVADKFDNGNGLIDWRKFMAALRPDWADRGPLTDAERIDDEINRQVALCTCRQKFKVMQVGVGKYRFGDSQKLRLVRILRSTVMVRVGGGWCSLDEFLVKNDPCRAKGRTNVELREQFTLAPGVSQGMATFKPKMSISGASPEASVSSSSGQRLSTIGPITKIKEKSERSLPMSGPSSLTGSYVEQRRPSNLSVAGGRGGSRPSSRAGSNLSLNSDELSAQGGSSVRRSSSMRSGGNGGSASGSTTRRTSSRPADLPTSVGFGSSSPRRISSPYANGRTPSNSSADRVPMAGRSRTPSSSNIPLPVAHPRARTPAGGGSESGFSGSDSIRRSSKTTTSTSYGADGSRITQTTTSFGSGSPSQQRASRN